MTYKWVSVFLVFFLLGCHTRNIRKEISNDDITVQWYYYSTLTEISPDIVSVQKRYTWNEVEIFAAYETVTDISIVDKKIIIKFYPEVMIDNDSIKSAFGYQVVQDSLATKEDLIKIPRGKKKWWIFW